MIDTGKNILNIVVYVGGYENLPWLAPLWITALWLMFATQLNGSLRFLQKRYLLALVAGAFGGPLAYFAGERIGAVEVLPDDVPATLILGVIWAVAVPGLLYLQAYLLPTNEEQN
jgi:hypothetical protein